MTETTEVSALVAGVNIDPQHAPTATGADKSSENANTPKVELRDGKYFLDGVRVYTREDTNKIASTASSATEARILAELKMDDLGKVKQVISQLQSDGSTDLNVQGLRDAVRRKEETLDELRSEVSTLKQQLVLKDHMGKLTDVMPQAWNSDQRQAVIDLMHMRKMISVEDNQFFLRQGDQLLTDDSGERPDYQAAVQIVAKTLGLSTTKSGVIVADGERIPEKDNTRGIDENKIKMDPSYRAAYIQVRERNRTLARDQITDAMVRKQMDNRPAGTASKMLVTSTAKTQPAKTNRR
jgi:hypothetical protein